ncbi:hypothetical protein vseg_020611 [Gypsophila vaccaria]
MITRGLYRENITLILGFIFFILFHANFIRTCNATPPAIFDVTKFGAKGNGKPDYNEDGESSTGLAFIQAWLKACNSIGPSTVLIPKGTFVVAQVLFSGPCQSSVTVDLQGNIMADTDVSQFPNNELIVFQQVEGARLVGAGKIDVNRPSSMVTLVDLEKPFLYSEVMPSISLMNVTKFEMSGVHSLNPEAFHVLVDSSHEVSISNVNFEATNLKPITRNDAIFISMSKSVKIINSNIKTGDACVTVSGGSNNVSISGVTCVNGKGIRVGAQPHATPDYNINKVHVKNCTFKGTTYGATINPRPQDALAQVSDIIFEDLVMDGVQNPIFIKQDFLSTPDKSHIAKVSNIQFKNIRGTATTKDALSISCSKTAPCIGIQVADVDLKVTGNTLLKEVTSLLSATCLNAKVAFAGKHDGLSC